MGLELAALLLLSLAAPSGAYLTTIAPLVFVAVFGSTSAFMAIIGLALAKARVDEQGAASGLLFTGQQIGLPAGVVIALTLLEAFPPGAGESPLAAFGQAFLAPAVLVAAGLAALVLLTRRPPPGAG